MLAHPQLPDFDPFEVLGVTPDDPPEVVKAAWRSRVKEHHPDAAGGSDAQIKRVNVAYEWLRDPTLRQLYLRAMGDRSGGGSRSEWEPEPAWPLYPDEPPAQTAYEGPRAASLEELGDRVGAASMDDLLELVHSYRPDRHWSVGLAQGIEASRRHEAGAAAVWQIRQRVRERLEELLVDAHTRAVYDDELVGHVVSDRLADLARGIVMLDLLMVQPRIRVLDEWHAVMGAGAEPPGDGPGLADPARTRSGLDGVLARILYPRVGSSRCCWPGSMPRS